MPLDITLILPGAPKMAMYLSDKRLYLDATRTNIVDESSPEAAYLLVAKGGELPMAEAQKYGLLNTTTPEPTTEAKAVEPKSDKSVKLFRNK